jgi:hypothetical protein
MHNKTRQPTPESRLFRFLSPWPGVAALGVRLQNMLSRSYRALRAVSLLAFLVALLLYVSSEVVTYASHRLEVRDKQHQVVGEVWIPHDYASHTFTSFCFLVLSGIQFWTIWLVGKKLPCKERQ